MTTDLDHGKNISPDNALHEPGAGDALQNPGWRYYMEDFLYPAKYVTESAVEEAEMKDELVTQIANRLAKILNRSGLRKRFALSENFNDMLRFDEINDIEGVMFASEDDTAFIRVKMTEEQGGAINFALMICDNTDDGLRVFNGTGWEYVDVREEYNVSTRLFQELMNTSDTTPAEQALLMAFCRNRERPTKAAWDRFRDKHRAAFELAKEMKNVLRMTLADDSVFLVPDDDDHVGIAISCRDDEFTVWQYLTNNDVLCNDELVFSSDTEEVVYHKKVFTLHGMEEALRFAQAHLDRNTLAEKAVTVPVSKTYILHAWEDALRNPDSILEAPGAKNEKYAKSLQGFADAVKKAKKAVN